MRLPGRPARDRGLRRRSRSRSPRALIERNPEAELWALGDPYREADFTLDLAAATDLRPAWERMERLGIESGRLGSERGL